MLSTLTSCVTSGTRLNLSVSQQGDSKQSLPWEPSAFQCLLKTHSSLTAQLVKNPPAMQETPDQFPGREDPLETGKATHSNILGLPWWLSW